MVLRGISVDFIRSKVGSINFFIILDLESYNFFVLRQLNNYLRVGIVLRVWIKFTKRERKPLTKYQTNKNLFNRHWYTTKVWLLISWRTTQDGNKTVELITKFVERVASLSSIVFGPPPSFILNKLKCLFFIIIVRYFILGFLNFLGFFVGVPLTLQLRRNFSEESVPVPPFVFLKYLRFWWQNVREKFEVDLAIQ